MILFGTTCLGSIQGGGYENFRKALIQRGVPETKFIQIEKDIEASMRLELEGDMLRRFGVKHKAAIEYQKATQIEEAAFGRENPCLAFLWRKIACLAAIVSKNMDGIDAEEMDYMDGKWLHEHTMSSSNQNNHKQQPQKQHRESRSSPLHPKVTRTILKGDDFYKSFLYSRAVEEYWKAATTDVRRKGRRRSRSNSEERKRRSRSSRSRSKSRRQSPNDSSRSRSKSTTPASTRRGRKPIQAYQQHDDDDEQQQQQRSSRRSDGNVLNELKSLMETAESESEIKADNPSSSTYSRLRTVDMPNTVSIGDSQPESNQQQKSELLLSSSSGHHTIVSKSTKKKPK
jgi:uncharacterized membrane protein YkoI